MGKAVLLHNFTCFCTIAFYAVAYGCCFVGCDFFFCLLLLFRSCVCFICFYLPNFHVFSLATIFSFGLIFKVREFCISEANKKMFVLFIVMTRSLSISRFSFRFASFSFSIRPTSSFFNLKIVRFCFSMRGHVFCIFVFFLCS